MLTLTNPPTQAATFNYNRVFVERGGLVYFGYQSKPIVNNSARLNTAASTALLPNWASRRPTSTPLALTAGSYSGCLRPVGNGETTGGTTVFIQSNGVFCQDRTSLAFDACTLTFTDTATGAFTFADTSSTAAGTIVFATGVASGTYHDPTTIPVDGTFAGRRR